MAGIDPFVGEVETFAFNFCPIGWTTLNGQLMPINQNTALFSLLGTTYGGNGVTLCAAYRQTDLHCDGRHLATVHCTAGRLPAP